MLLILLFILDLHTSIFEYPIVYRSDMLPSLMHIKMIIGGDYPLYSYVRSEYLSLPFGLIEGDFPHPDISNILFIKLISLFTHNLFTVANIYIILSYFMIVNSMFFILSRLRVDNYLAIVISLLYALVPYHYLRIETGHLWYFNYFLLPITIYLLLMLWSKKPLFFIKRSNGKGYRFDLSLKNLIIISVLIIFSLWTYYQTFFFVLFVFAVTISSFYYRRNRYHIYSGLLMVFFVTAPFVASLTPYKIYQYENGKNSQVANRSAAESEIYGLKIAQMLLPVDKHNNALLSKIKSEYNEKAPLINENRFATLGIIGTIGFMAMTLLMLFHERFFSTVKKLSIIGYTAVMIATIGGYSSLFALLITPQIRGYNRISIYIATLALMVFALLFNQLMKRYSLKTLSRVSLSLAILCIGIYDQVPSYMTFDPSEKLMRTFQSDRNFIHSIESKLSAEGEKKVFQLPYMSYPEHPPINHMNDYAQLVGFLHSGTIRWSYGAVRGRKSDKWIKRLISLPLEEQVAILKSSGFNGIYIDRRGYRDNAKSLEADLSGILISQPIISEDSNKSFFKMKATGDQTYLFDDQPEFTEGFHGWEGKFGSHGWSSGDCKLKFDNSSNQEKSVIVSFTLGTLEKRNVSIYYGKERIKSIDLDNRQTKKVSISLLLKPGKNILLFKTDTKALRPGGNDKRGLAFYFGDLKFKYLEE